MFGVEELFEARGVDILRDAIMREKRTFSRPLQVSLSIPSDERIEVGLSFTARISSAEGGGGSNGCRHELHIVPRSSVSRVSEVSACIDTFHL